MKKITNTYLLVLFFIAAMLQASAQKTAITFSFLNAGFYANTSPVTQGHMGLGLERNVGDHISLKLEINKGFQVLYSITNGKLLNLNGTGDEERSWDDGTGNYSSFYYHWTVPSFEMNYQSKFFFRGNDQTGPYMSMGIGFRSIKYIFHVGAIDEYTDDETPNEIQRKDKYSETLTVIPLMLRIGVRGDLEGFFPDFSFGIGYNMSNNKTIKDRTITNTWDLSVPKLSGLAITAGISFGVGW